MAEASSTIHVEEELGDYRYVVEKRNNGQVELFRELTDGSSLSPGGPEHIPPTELPTEFLRREYNNLMTPGGVGA